MRERNRNTTLKRECPLPKDPDSFTIKKNNSYSAVYANQLKFLDVSQFQAPGMSYAKFLKAYGVKESKGYYPYEYMDSVDKLDETKLPPYEAFYSKLKQCNVLDDEDDPRIGRERWETLDKLWKEKGFKTMADYTAYYNNLDVGPMVTAVERMQEFYFKRNIDVFKTAISTPGIARQMLFNKAKAKGVSFASILGQDEDLFYSLNRYV